MYYASLRCRSFLACGDVVCNFNFENSDGCFHVCSCALTHLADCEPMNLEHPAVRPSKAAFAHTRYPEVTTVRLPARTACWNDWLWRPGFMKQGYRCGNCNTPRDEGHTNWPKCCSWKSGAARGRTHEEMLFSEQIRKLGIATSSVIIWTAPV